MLTGGRVYLMTSILKTAEKLTKSHLFLILFSANKLLSVSRANQQISVFIGVNCASFKRLFSLAPVLATKVPLFSGRGRLALFVLMIRWLVTLLWFGERARI